MQVISHLLKTELQYSVKHLRTGASRVYINASGILNRIGLRSGVRLTATYSKHRIEVDVDPNGKKSVQNTGRGLLVELKDKATATALSGLDVVVVRFEANKLVISARRCDLEKVQRERSLVRNIASGCITMASLCSGIGYSAFKITEGLKKQGLRAQMAFSNDIDPLAMALQIEGNPIWNNRTNEALAINADIRDLNYDQIPFVNFVEVAYPCQGQSKLSPVERRDLNHPEVGTLFVPIINVLRSLNPAVILIENTEAFVNSMTLDLMRREMKGYRFESIILNGYEWGDFEERKRACIVAVSDGLPDVNLNELVPPAFIARKPISTILENVCLDHVSWGVKPHIKKKLHDKRLNFKLNVYHGHEDKVASLVAGNQSPKINSPFIGHPSYNETGLMRLFNVVEHARIRELPDKLFKLIVDVAEGLYPMVSSRGSNTAAHRLLGNCPSPKAMVALGAYLGQYFSNLCCQPNHL